MTRMNKYRSIIPTLKELVGKRSIYKPTSIIGISNNNDEIFGPLLKPPSVDTISIGNVTLFHKIIVCCNGGSNMHVMRNGTFFPLNMLR